MNEDTIEQIQTKIAYLERTTTDLSDMVFRQHQEIRVLEARLKSILERLSGAQSEEAPPSADQERPPHY
jgi:uncharacterized coiled-coil protein SlyX